MNTPRPHVIVLFGATGDLARRKLLPGLLHLSSLGLMPRLPDRRHVARTSSTTTSSATLAREACERVRPRPVDRRRRSGEFVARLSYVATRRAPRAWPARSSAPRPSSAATRDVLHYLSVPPGRRRRGHRDCSTQAGLAERARVIMEKPFGTDLASAPELERHASTRVFDEEQIFRIDHFLGKEAAQNILALRFANGLFEPIWNRDHIDHIQIDVPETLGGRQRAPASTSRPAPTATWSSPTCSRSSPSSRWSRRPRSSPDAITEEKNKVFRSLRPLDPSQVVRGQYEGYRSRAGGRPRVADRDLRRAALRDRQLALERRPLLPAHRQAAWPKARRIISIAFREPPKSMFPATSGVGQLRPRPPHLRPRRVLAPLALLLRQAARARDGARQAEHAVLARGDRAGGRRARGLRAPDPRRDRTATDPLHDRGGDRAPVGGRRRRCSTTHRPCCPTRRAPGARTRFTT